MLAPLLFLILAVTFAAAKPTWNNLNGYTFEKFVGDFAQPWVKGSAEYINRQKLFETELARVAAHNALGKSWKEGINKFSAMTLPELKAYKGRSKNIARTHQPKFQQASTLPLKPVSQLPTEVDWRKANIVSPVKDQGSCGSCWAFAATAVMESAVAKESGLLYELSVDQTAFCSPNPEKCGGTGGCSGATAEVAFDHFAAGTSLFQEYQSSYQGYRGGSHDCAAPVGAAKATISGFVKLPVNNYTALVNAVATVGPISISLDANFGAYESGVFNGCDASKNVDIDHAVVLVGYGEDNGQKYWLVRNSWSPSWGEAGYIRIARSEKDESNCATDSTPEDGNACEGEHDPVTVCGVCGLLYDSSYPTGAAAL